MNATDRLGQDMIAAATVRWITLVITVFVSSFLLGLLLLAVVRTSGEVSRSVTQAAFSPASNWNAQSLISGPNRR